MFFGSKESKIFQEFATRDYTDGEVIVSEGDVDNEMFIIQKGSVRVTKLVNGVEVELSVLERGEFFGEMALLESLPRSATVKALGPTKIQVVQPGGLMLKFRRDPTFAFEMLQRLSGRLRSMNELLVDSLDGRRSDKDSTQEIADRAEYGGVTRGEGGEQ